MPVLRQAKHRIPDGTSIWHTGCALNRKAIRRYMVEHDMSRKQLAKMCGTSPITFGRYLNGHSKLPLRVPFNMATSMKPADLIEGKD